MPRFLNIAIYSFLVLLALGCTKYEKLTPDKVYGVKPVYIFLMESDIKAVEPREIVDGSSIILFEDFLFILDKFKGVHIIDNSDPANPINLKFIQIPGVSQATFDDNVLFVNFGNDLLLLDITDIDNVFIKSRIENFYPKAETELSPPDYSGHFECVDPNLGTVVGWETDSLIQPKCRVF